MLNRLAEHYEQEVENGVSAVISVMPLLITIVLGVLVGTLIVSFYTSSINAIEALGL
jgi:type II secretory pathway component PulF